MTELQKVLRQAGANLMKVTVSGMNTIFMGEGMKALMLAQQIVDEEARKAKEQTAAAAGDGQITGEAETV